MGNKLRKTRHVRAGALPCWVVVLGLLTGLLTGSGAWAGLALSGPTTVPSPNPKLHYTIGIMQIVEHEALDSIHKGVLASLQAKHLLEVTEVDYLNAQGNMVTMGQIGKKLISAQPDAIVAIGTPAAQAAINRNQRVPVIFSPITDPVGAKLVKDLKRPGGIATGSSDLCPIKDQLALIKKILPLARKIAIMYNPGEANSVYLAAEFEAAAKSLGLIPITAAVQNTAMVLTTARSINADAIFIPTDNTVASAIDGVIKAGLSSKTPVFAADSNLVKKGALAALSVDYEELGKITGDMLIEVMQHSRKPGEMPVRFLDHFKLAINKGSALAWGITFPADILQKAELIY